MTDFKWFLVVLVILMVGLLTWMFVDTAFAEPYLICVVDAGGGLKVREGPGVEFRTSFILSDRAEIIVMETQDNWALANFRSLVGRREPFGWVCMDYLIKCYEVNIK